MDKTNTENTKDSEGHREERVILGGGRGSLMSLMPDPGLTRDGSLPASNPHEGRTMKAMNVRQRTSVIFFFNWIDPPFLRALKAFSLFAAVRDTR